jgi:hypothetical protein
MRQTFRRDADSSLTTVFLPLAHKSAIYGEGSGPKRQPEDPKSAISEKEELRKVLFSKKHMRELPGASSGGKPLYAAIVFAVVFRRSRSLAT